jgi:hypothetical protein
VTRLADLEGVISKLFGRLFGRPTAEAVLLLRKDEGGRSEIVCTWSGGGWSGSFEMRRTHGEELTARDLDAVVRTLREL